MKVAAMLATKARKASGLMRKSAVVAIACILSALLTNAALSQGVAVPDFDAAMKGLRFDPAVTDGNGPNGAGNGLKDADEMALVAEIMKRPGLDLRSRGGVDHAAVAAALAQARTSAIRDMTALSRQYPTAADAAAGYAMLGNVSKTSYSAMSAGFGAPMNGDYGLALALDRFLSPEGDADGDGVSNGDEYLAQAAGGRAAFLRAALDPAIRERPNPQAIKAAAAKAPGRIVIGLVLYPGFEVLDVFGPLEMWANVPDFQVVLIAQTKGEVRSAQGAKVVADYGFEDAPALDVMMVPGGVGTRTELENPAYLAFLKARDPRTRYTTSVCTGSALLAKAGLLKGRRATSNKAFFSLAVDQDPSVTWAKSARWVEDGKYLTSSGVSAGTDMALGLVALIHGKARAEQLAKSLEYQWNDDPNNDPFALH